MDTIVLAKCWTLDDGTVCVLSKIGHEIWEVRVSRGPRLMRVETFNDLGIAVSSATAWRVHFMHPLEDIA